MSQTNEHLCLECGETMSHERFEEGKMCCDAPRFEEEEDEETPEEVFDRKHPNATCHRCESKLTGATVVYCGGGGGAFETWYCAECHEEGTHDCCVCGGQ